MCRLVYAGLYSAGHVTLVSRLLCIQGERRNALHFTILDVRLVRSLEALHLGTTGIQISVFEARGCSSTVGPHGIPMDSSRPCNTNQRTLLADGIFGSDLGQLHGDRLACRRGPWVSCAERGAIPQMGGAHNNRCTCIYACVYIYIQRHRDYHYKRLHLRCPASWDRLLFLNQTVANSNTLLSPHDREFIELR